MSELVENETKICEGTSEDPGSNLRCLYQELNKSKDIIKNQKILKDILRVLTYPYIQSGSRQYKLLANDDVRIADTYRLPEPIDKTYKIKVKGEDISLTKKTDKIVVSDSNKEYNLTEDGKYVIIDTYKLITTNQNGITTYKIILNDLRKFPIKKIHNRLNFIKINTIFFKKTKIFLKLVLKRRIGKTYKKLKIK